MPRYSSCHYTGIAPLRTVAAYDTNYKYSISLNDILPHLAERHVWPPPVADDVAGGAHERLGAEAGEGGASPLGKAGDG